MGGEVCRTYTRSGGAMKFIETILKGACIIEIERLEDERGFFARTFCRRDFKAHGLNPWRVQCSISYNRRRGTLRGMHYQASPMSEAKLVRCTQGAIYDVIIDLRKESPAYCKWTAVELSADNYMMLYIPEGFAHGYQTLEDDTDVFYQMSQYYAPEFARGVRYDDPALGITWPLDEKIVSESDKKYPFLNLVEIK